MKKIISMFILFSFVSVPLVSFAQEDAKKEVKQEVQKEVGAKDASAANSEKEKDVKEDSKVKFSPKNTRDPFLSKEEVEKIERARRAEVEKVERERREREKAAIAAREAEKAKLEREAYLKANPHLAIVQSLSRVRLFATP